MTAIAHETEKQTLQQWVKKHGSSVASVGGLVFCLIFFTVTTGLKGESIWSASKLATLIGDVIVTALMAVGAVFIYSLGNMDVSIGKQVGLYSTLLVLVGNATGSLWIAILVCLLIAVFIGIINGAGGIGGSILSPVTQALMDAGGLRAISACFMILSGLITVVCVWLFTQERGAVKEESQEKPDEPVLKQIGEAVRSRDFLHAALAFFTCGYFMAIIETQLYSQIVSLGFPGTSAAFGFTIYGIFGMLGPMLSGFLCTKMRCKWVVGTCYALRPVAVLLFYLMKPSLFSVYFFLIFLGLIGNSTVPPTSNLISKLYGVRKVGLLLGTAFVFHQIGSFISTWLGGVLGANGQYLLLWVTGAVLATAAALLCYTVKEPAE